MSAIEANCVKTNYHSGFEDEFIICATDKDDIARMHQLYRDASIKVEGQNFETAEEYEEALTKVQPKFHIIYPIASFDEIRQMEEAYRELVMYATSFEVQFGKDIPDNKSEKYIRLNIASPLPYSRLIFSGTKDEPTIVSNMMIHVKADTVIVNHLKFVHRLPTSAIKADVSRAFLSQNIVFENTPEVPHAMKFAEEPLISVYSTQNAPYDVTIEHSVFENNRTESILAPCAAESRTMKSITLSDVEISDNSGGFDISASESALIDNCTVSQHKPAPAFILRSPNTDVTIRNSTLSGFVMKFKPSSDSSPERPKPITETNNTEADDTRYDGWK